MTTPECREMIPGRSSVQLDRIFAGPFMVAVFSLLPFVSGRLLENFGLRIPPALLVAAAVAIACCGIPAVILQIMELRRRKEEEAAGYTLFRGRRLDLPLLDWKTGIVLRAAGESEVSVKVYRQRLDAARSITSPEQ